MDTVLKVDNGFIDQNVIFERFRCKKVDEMRAEPNISQVEFYEVNQEVTDNGKDG